MAFSYHRHLSIMSTSSLYSQLPTSYEESSGDSALRAASKRKTSKYVFGHKTRMYIMMLLLICLTLPQMNSIIFNFTVICMNDLIEEHHARNLTGSHWMESSTKKSLIFSASAVGAVIGLVPSVPLIDYLGIRVILTISGIISAIGTLLFPLATAHSYYSVICCRVLHGLGVSILFTVVGVIPGVWAPSNETGTFLAILSCAFQLSMIICMPISGILCESSAFGWPSIYYIFGCSTILFFIVFFVFYADSPRLHRNVSEKELELIEEGKLETVKGAIPYWAICTDQTVLAAWLSVFGASFAFTILTFYGPTYLKDVLKFDVKETGYAAALPFITSALVKFAAGGISDRLQFLSEKFRFTFCTVLSQGSVVLGLLIMAMSTSRNVAQFAYTFAITSSGLNIVGNIKCIQLRCRQHVHFAITVISVCAYLIHFGAPIVVGSLTSETGNTSENWSRLFIIVSVITVATNAPFPFLTSEEPGPFVRAVKKASEYV